VSPEAPLEIRRLPTCFGPMDLVLSFRKEGTWIDVDLVLPARDRPDAVVLHVPEFIDPVSLHVDGRPAACENGVLALPRDRGRVVVSGACVGT
jgi:hypothetical protein